MKQSSILYNSGRRAEPTIPGSVFGNLDDENRAMQR